VPHTNELQKKYGDRGLVIIGIHSQNGAETMTDGVKRHGIQYPVAADTSGATVAAYRVNSYPDYYFIDRAGNLRIVDCANGKVEQAIELLLSESAE
jgi:hypothetical protein